MNSINAISPIDGRYSSKTAELVPFFSEWGLFKYRVWVEIEYFIALHTLEIPNVRVLSSSELVFLREIYQNFSSDDALQIKEIEKTTNHDVKAVEYFIKEKLAKTDLASQSEFVHFGLTSQDINNTAIPMSINAGLREVIIPNLENFINTLEAFAKEWRAVPMLSRTHGQAATPTTLGKEIEVFSKRLSIQLSALKTLQITGKFGGATGAFNAHLIAYPSINWNEFAENLLLDFGVKRSYPTTQIDHYDQLSACFDNLKRINVILLDFAKDVWQYISLDYFKQKIKQGEVGSSAMPHKVNPIDFENAEGNLGMANALLDHLSNKLPVSRLQRDLTDSTVLRNVGTPFAHILISLKSLQNGCNKLILNTPSINQDLENNWAVVAEAIQTILRREQVPGAYEILKDLTRTNQGINQDTITAFVNQLDISDAVKNELLAVTPFNYLGYANR